MNALVFAEQIVSQLFSLLFFLCGILYLSSKEGYVVSPSERHSFLPQQHQKVVFLVMKNSCRIICSRIFQKTKCSEDKVSKKQSVEKKKCPENKVSKRQSVQKDKCQKDKVSRGQIVKNTKCPEDKVSRKQSVKKKSV